MRTRTPQHSPETRTRWPIVALVVALGGEATAAPRIDYRGVLAGGGYVVSDVAVDRDGSAWVVGTTTNHLLPVTPTAVDTQFDAGDFDEGYVLKFDPAGALVYASYLGGRNVDDFASIDIDDEGSVYVAGTTLSDNLPTTVGAHQPMLASPGAEDAYLAKLDRDGQLVAATYFGGNCRDLYPGGSRGNPGVAVALGPENTLYLAGGTCSTDLPTSSGYQRQYGGGSQDAFLARFDRDLDFARCTYLGGANNEGAYRLAVDPDGNVHLFGLVTRLFGQEWSFPVTPGALLSNPRSEPYDFIARFEATGDLVYATFFGPDGGDYFLSEYQGDLAVDASGNAYIVGTTAAASFPTTAGAFQTTRRGFSDLFVSKLSADGSTLVWSTLFGGGQAEYANGEPGVRAAVHEGGVYVAGQTDSTDLPLLMPFESTRTGGFVAKLTLDGELEYASFVLPEPFGVEALVAGRAPLGTALAPPHIGVYVAGPHASATGGVPIGVTLIGIDELGGVEPACLGDCDGDGGVVVSELIVGVNAALGLADVAGCAAFDPDGDGQVVVADLVRAVGFALGTCPAAG
jgi:hypothetical protein